MITLKLINHDDKSHNNAYMRERRLRETLEDSPHYQGALDFARDVMTDMSTEGAVFSTDSAKFLLKKGREMLHEFIVRNINFCESQHDLISRIDGDLHFAGHDLEEIDEFLKDPDKLLPEWCSPRELDLEEMTEMFEKNIHSAATSLTQVQASFTDYLQRCQTENQHPNLPMVRIKSCLERAAKDRIDFHPTAIHHFNWARHIKRVIVDLREAPEATWDIRRKLEPLEATMRTAENLFYDIKDDFNDSVGRPTPSARRAAQKGTGREIKKGYRWEVSQRTREMIETKIAKLQEIFMQGAALANQLSNSLIPPMEKTGHWNLNLSSSWCWERDEDCYPYAHNSRRAKRGAARPNISDCAPDNRKPDGQRDGITSDLVAGGLTAGFFGISGSSSEKDGMGGMGD